MQGLQTHLDEPKPTQSTNQGPDILENADALKSQTVEPHSHPCRPGNGHSSYHLGTHTDLNNTN